MINSELLKLVAPELEIDPTKIVELFSRLIDELAGSKTKFAASDYRWLITHREYKQGFGNRLLYEYSAPIQDLELYTELCRTIALGVSKRLARPHEIRVTTLRRLFEKSTLIASEVLHLIKGGYPSAAMSRWRSLLETSVIAVFLAVSENEVSERYLAYAKVEAKKELNTYLQYFHHLGYDEIPKETIEMVTKGYEKAKEVYGSDFTKDFGWAYQKLEKKKITFHDLLEYTNSSYMKPYYKLANNYVHGGPKSLLHNLGYIDGVLEDHTISAPSNIGFTDPAQLTALSYFNSTFAFFTTSPDKTGFTQIVEAYGRINVIAEQFHSVEQDIVAREKEFNEY